ncbi:MAG: hypothetical protein GY749_16160 [Desulfobacteraceae bacterium]|nr:hypothetical protein [Desulfobacteraceae bacterium]
MGKTSALLYILYWKCRAELVIFETSGNLRLAYRVVTTPGLLDGRIFVVDAQTVDILKKISAIHTPGLDFSLK